MTSCQGTTGEPPLSLEDPEPRAACGSRSASCQLEVSPRLSRPQRCRQHLAKRPYRRPSARARHHGNRVSADSPSRRTAASVTPRAKQAESRSESHTSARERGTCRAYSVNPARATHGSRERGARTDLARVQQGHSCCVRHAPPSTSRTECPRSCVFTRAGWRRNGACRSFPRNAPKIGRRLRPLH